MEDDLSAIAGHTVEWGNLLELDVTPVLEHEAAGAAMGKVYGWPDTSELAQPKVVESDQELADEEIRPGFRIQVSELLRY